MKIILSAILAAALLCLPAPAQTYRHQVPAVLQAASGVTAPTPQDWYLRMDGGTRYSTNNPSGQCDGKGDAPAPAAGLINQHCAFGDLRYFAFDGTYNASGGKWVILGGDTVHIHKGQYRDGYNGPNVNDYMLANGYSVAVAGNPFAVGMPAIPSGTAAQHTKIVGDDVATTQIFGGYGAFSVLDLSGSAFVDITGVELTRHSQCTIYGVPPSPANCNKNFGTLDDYALNGLITTNSTHDILLQNVHIHGFPSRGIIGPIGGTITAKNVDIAYNAGAGWDFDDGSATPSVNGLINLSGVTIEWSGCNQAYPGPGAVSCYSQSTGGYGDGIGTPTGTCVSANVDNSTFRYNTQDGYDMLHNDTGNCVQHVTSSASYGNNGQQFKWGPANSGSTLTNSFIAGFCSRLSAPFPGQPSTYNANLQDFCRADSVIALDFYNGTTMTLSNNTVISTSSTLVDYACVDQNNPARPASTTASCANSVLTYGNTINLAYSDPIEEGYGGDGAPGGWCGAGCDGSTLPLGTVNRTNNLYFGFRSNLALAPTEKIADPLFVGEPAGNGSTFTEAELDNFNDALASASPAVGMGATAGTVVTAPPPPPPVVVPPAPKYPLTFTTVVTVPAATITVPAIKPPMIQPAPVMPPSITVPASTKTCTFTQASATASAVLQGCK